MQSSPLRGAASAPVALSPPHAPREGTRCLAATTTPTLRRPAAARGQLQQGGVPPLRVSAEELQRQRAAADVWSRLLEEQHQALLDCEHVALHEVAEQSFLEMRIQESEAQATQIPLFAEHRAELAQHLQDAEAALGDRSPRAEAEELRSLEARTAGLELAGGELRAQLAAAEAATGRVDRLEEARAGLERKVRAAEARAPGEARRLAQLEDAAERLRAQLLAAEGGAAR